MGDRKQGERSCQQRERAQPAGGTAAKRRGRSPALASRSPQPPAGVGSGEGQGENLPGGIARTGLQHQRGAAAEGAAPRGRSEQGARRREAASERSASGASGGDPWRSHGGGEAPY